jgi:hypothetical protein
MFRFTSLEGRTSGRVFKSPFLDGRGQGEGDNYLKQGTWVTIGQDEHKKEWGRVAF